MTDFETARANMVDSQIRPCDITDRRILAAMSSIPREDFLPGHLRDLAYMDRTIKIGEGNWGRFLPAPMIFAKLVQLCAIEAGDLVLEIGTASGYGAAVLAALSDSVLALESDGALAQSATDNLISHDIANAAIIEGMLEAGLAAQGPYDVILLEGMIPHAPQNLLDQLKPGGRLVAVIGDEKTGKAHVFTRHDKANGTQFSNRQAFDANLPPLPGFAKTESFVF